MFDDDSITANSNTDSITPADLQKPILVGYAFGPKKMSTMATVMAEEVKFYLFIKRKQRREITALIKSFVTFDRLVHRLVATKDRVV
mmetsp:Transcript_4344/g.6255  ORF Transcript_4344/g.6255 Transcript_4344/m.6255 type:complete len:87 (-) Transcript_4344:2522-2782(-)